MRLLVVVIAACRFTPGTVPDDGSVGAGDVRDGTEDAIGANCYSQWLDHTVRLHTPQPLTALNVIGGYERDPFVTDDEKTIYWSTNRATASTDIWMATRANKTDPFSGVMAAIEFNSIANETKLSITSNGLTAVVGSDRLGTLGSVDVWESTRASTSEFFPAMTRAKVMMVETVGADHDPTISANGLHLYLAPDLPAPQQIAMASRANPSGDFGTAMPLPELRSGTGDADPSPTPDERIIVFASNRDGGNIWYATRAGSTGTFDAPQVVPDVNTAFFEGDPHMSADGCRLYFARYTGIGLDWDLYEAAVQ